MTRFQLIPGPRSYPHFDIITSDTDQFKPVFDLGIVLDGYDGSVFIQPIHIEEMARTLGMATKEHVDLLLAENRRLQALVDALPNRTEELKNGLANLVSDFHSGLVADSAESASVENNSGDIEDILAIESETNNSSG